MKKPRLKLTVEILRGRCQIDADSGCWLWPLARNGYGYPVVSHQGKQVTAHRLAFVLAGRKLAAGARLAHVCGERACINPAHMKALQGGDFIKWQRATYGWARTAAGKARAAIGRRQASDVKLDYDKAREIRARYAAGESLRALGRAYGVNGTTIHAVVQGRRWAEPTPWQGLA